MRRKIGKVWVYGEELDQHSRCRHYRTRELSISDYLGCQFHCPACEAPFNPRCARHYHLYFEQ